MNKTAIKNFAIWARNKLIADISYKAGLLGIKEKGIQSPLPQSTQTVQFFDIGTKEPSSITGVEIQQRKKLVEEIERKAKQSDHTTAYKNVIEEVAYTWFNRLIAIRFMEVNDYLPTRIRVLSSESNGKAEPDLVTHALEANLDYSAYEKDRIIQLKHENKLDELFRMLFIKQCNALNDNLPKLFEKTSDYTELLLNVSFTDKEGVVYHLVNDISEDDFNISKIGEDGKPTGQVEIIGWLYQYYNTELNEEVYDGSLSKSKIPKELLPAATTIYTPDWTIHYMVENSLGRLWLEGHPNPDLKFGWKYYLDEVEQKAEVQAQLDKIREKYQIIKPEDIKVIDPCMGSGHILVYSFDVLMQIYEVAGYTQREAAKSILENNIYGLDIDDRAFQLAYFAVTMKARQYNRRILNRETICHVHSIRESNMINRAQLKYFGADLNDLERNDAMNQITGLLDTFVDAKEYGSILNVEVCNWGLLRRFVSETSDGGQMSLDSIGLENTKEQLRILIEIGQVMAQKYDVVVTNPPYFGSSRFSPALSRYVNEYYSNSKADLSMVMYDHVLTHMLQNNGFTAFITTTSWMYLKSFDKLRSKVLAGYMIDSLVDFGTELFDGKVGHNPIVSWVLRNTNLRKQFVAVRLANYCYSRRDEKEAEFFSKKNYYYPDSSDFAKIPSKTIAYYASKPFIENFEKGITVDTISDFTGSQHKTANNDLYLRYWYEIDTKKINGRWIPYVKGGEFKKWFGNLDLMIDWSTEAVSYYKKNATSNLLAEQYRFKEGITYTSLSSAANGFRYLPAIGIFDIKGPSIVNMQHLYYVLALFNTKVANKYFATFNSTITLQVKDVKAFPIIIDAERYDTITKLSMENVNISKDDWNSFESSWDYNSHPFMKYRMEGSLIKIAQLWKEETNRRFDTVYANEVELNRLFISIYNMGDELTPEMNEKDITIYKADAVNDVKTLLSYAIGCIFGRYSLDSDGLCCTSSVIDESNYKSIEPDSDNIIPITDEAYFEDDLIARICNFIKVAFGEKNLEANLDYIAGLLPNKGNTSREVIRDYFIRNFFEDHSARCTVGVGGKRPYYWLFSSGDFNGFKALIYMHRYDENTIGNIRIDYLHRMQRIYENEIARMQDTIENSKDAREVTAATKRKEKLIKQLQETKEYDEKIAHLALARTSIDLDDGVKVNYEKVQTDRDGKKLDVLAKI